MRAKNGDIFSGGMEMEQELMSATEVARFLGVSRASVSQWARSGRLRGLKLNGTRWVFSRSNVIEFQRLK